MYYSFIKDIKRGRYQSTALLCFISLFFVASMQAQVSSPYSRFGLGSLRPTTFSGNRGFGGLAAGYASTANINYTNPASYASISMATFEIGVNVDGATIRTKDSAYTTANGSISHVAIAVPLKKGVAGLSFGLLPFSNINYTFIENRENPSFGGYQNIYKGNGSLYQVYLGVGAQVKGFSIGANASYMFGKLDYAKYIIFQDSVDALNSRNLLTFRATGFTYNVGVQYRFILKKSTKDNDLKHTIFMTAGAYGSSQIPVRSKVTDTWQRFYYASDGSAYVLDTLTSSAERKSTFQLPINFGVGITAGNEANWLIGADFKYAKWGSFKSDLNNDAMADSWRFIVGAQITPNYESRKPLGKLQIKFGGYYGMSEIRYNGVHLPEAGGTFGFGIPITRRDIARINLMGEVGSRGLNNPKVISETYYRLSIGFVLNARDWFQQPKYD